MLNRGQVLRNGAIVGRFGEGAQGVDSQNLREVAQALRDHHDMSVSLQPGVHRLSRAYPYAEVARLKAVRGMGRVLRVAQGACELSFGNDNMAYFMLERGEWAYAPPGLTCWLVSYGTGMGFQFVTAMLARA